VKYTARSSDSFRSFIFGVEDSLVSTVGLISGVAVAGTKTSFIILTGIVLIFVEAFSMAVGALLSDNSVKEFEQKEDVAIGSSVKTATVMFFSYLLSGFLVISPYYFLNHDLAFTVSIAISVICLFILGTISAHFSNTSYVKKGLTMAVIGGLAVGIGILISNLVSNLQ